ncbi:MAG: 2-amino-4-hydroxy-6-hydroxymethyldihydropteridine diphosphokinase [Verrucomicrobiia bacterium]
MRTGIALGSNLGDRLAYLCMGRALIEALPGVSAPLLSSRVWETEPVGCPPGSPAFFNAVIEIDWAGEPGALLDALLSFEQKAGRPTTHGVNTPRTLDLDLLYIGNKTLTSKRLVLPHPRIGHRLFVLQPLCDIRPDLCLPGWDMPASTRLAQLYAWIQQNAETRIAPLPFIRLAGEQW